MENIKIKVIDTPTETFRDTPDIDITLDDGFMLYEFDGYCQTEGIENYFLERRCVSKKDISFIRLVWNEINEQYQITLFVKGVNPDGYIELFFIDFPEANSVFKMIMNWRFEL